MPELIFRTFGSFEDMISNTAFQDHAGAIDIASTFSTTGLTCDGSQYVLMFERDADGAAGSELIFRTFGSFDGMVANTGFRDHAGAIDIASTFSTRGLLTTPNDGGATLVPLPGSSWFLAGAAMALFAPLTRRRSAAA